ncbi:MAG TPA: hypothetical protein GXZ48_00610 [Acholeplasmataceae bacterium]|nr:hypothetical protein [Acholeplasmataceae bacterium]
MNSNIYDIHPSQSWVRHDDGQRLIPFLTGAVVSAPFWWATRPPVPFPYPFPLPYPYPIFPRFPRRFYGRRPFRPYRPFY